MPVYVFKNAFAELASVCTLNNMLQGSHEITSEPIWA